MKVRVISVLFILPLVMILYGFGGDFRWDGGSPGGYSGSPGDGKDCTNCHGGTASQVLGWISSDIPANGYVPGETYTINISVSGNGDKGFEVSPQTQEGDPLGTLIDGAGVHLVSGNKAVTHDDNSSANPAEWQFDWIAPVAGTGAVTFYGAFTVNKPVTKLCTYIVQENTGVSIVENTNLSTRVYPNPVTDELKLFIESNTSGPLTIKLISMTGAVYELYNTAKYSAGAGEVLLPVAESAKPGIYILRVEMSEEVSNTRIVIQ